MEPSWTDFFLGIAAVVIFLIVPLTVFALRDQARSRIEEAEKRRRIRERGR